MCLFRFPASCHTPDGNISSPVPLSIRSVPLSLSNKHPPTYVEYTGRVIERKKREASFSHKVRIVTSPTCSKFTYSGARQNKSWARQYAACNIFVSKIWWSCNANLNSSLNSYFRIPTAGRGRTISIAQNFAGSTETPNYHLINSNPHRDQHSLMPTIPPIWQLDNLNWTRNCPTKKYQSYICEKCHCCRGGGVPAGELR